MAFIEPFIGARSQIRALFELADDSVSEIDGYIEAGDVLVARSQGEIVGHVQLIPSANRWEIKSIAVLAPFRRHGISTKLVHAALEHALADGCIGLTVGTAAADIDNLAFYQRLGFRIDHVERNVFTADRGYPMVESHGIGVRDRVWLLMEFNGQAAAESIAPPQDPLRAERLQPATILIRSAVSDDAMGITRRFLESAEYHARLDPERYFTPSVEAISARYREGRQHRSSAGCDAITLVAELAGEIVGFIDAQLEQSLDAMHREMTYCHIAEIAVSGRHRNQGIGGRLLRAAEDWGRRQGAEFASLDYHAANTRAREFYHQRLLSRGIDHSDKASVGAACASAYVGAFLTSLWTVRW